MRPKLHKRGRMELSALWAVVIVGAIGAATSVVEPRAGAIGYRCALFVCLAPGVGCLILVLLHRIVGGQWGTALAPYLRAGADLLPWVWLLAFPMLFFPAPSGGLPRRDGLGGMAYDGRSMVALRACVYAAVFFGLRWLVKGGIGRDRGPRHNVRPWAGPVGLIVLAFMLTLLADDWLESLEAGWHSTAFAAVWMTGQVVTGLSLILVFALRDGVSPESRGAAGRPLGRDWGNLLLASVVFWSYLAFAQFLIIWAGNLPEEISWFLRRERGPWELVVPGVAFFGFGVPFLLLLSRRVKNSARGLVWTAAMLLAAQLAYAAWVIIPAEAPISLRGSAAIAAVLAASVGLFLGCFAQRARHWRLASP